MSEEQEKKSSGGRIGGHIRNALIAGALIAVPIAIAFVLIRWAFTTIDGLLRTPVRWVVERFVEIPENWQVPGLGLVALLIIVYILGLIWTKRLGRRTIRTMQHLLLKVPVIGAVYGPAKQLIESFTGEGSAGFKRVVVVEYPKQGTWMIGFLTGISDVVPGSTMGIIYLPTAPTPNSGWVAMVPVQNIYDTTMSVQEAMSMVLSGGIDSPTQINLKPMDPREAAEFVALGPEANAPKVSPESGVFNLPFIKGPDDKEEGEEEGEEKK